MKLLNFIPFLFTDSIISNFKTHPENYMKNLTIPLKKFNKIPFFYIPNAINCNYWKPSKNKIIHKKYDICMIANLYNERRIRIKGFNYFYEALNILKNKHKTNLKVIVIGHYNRNTIEKVIKSKINMSIEFTGPILNTEELKEKIQESKIFVLCSISEGMPNALMEAMALEVPVVATNVGAVNELINNNINGYLIPSKDPNLLAEKIFNLLNNEQIYNKYMKNGREFILTYFGWDTNIKIVQKIYKDIIKGKK